MILRNTTDFSDYFIRSMISWVCSRKAVGWSPDKIGEVTYEIMRRTGCAATPCPELNGFQVFVPPRRKTKSSVIRRYLRERSRVGNMVEITAREIARLAQGEPPQREYLQRKHLKKVKEQVGREFGMYRDWLPYKWMVSPSGIAEIRFPLWCGDDLGMAKTLAKRHGGIVILGPRIPRMFEEDFDRREYWVDDPDDPAVNVKRMWEERIEV